VTRAVGEVEVASYAAPAAGVVAVALLGSAAQLQRGLGMEPPSEASDGFFGPKRWRIRTLAIAGTWIALLTYSVLLAPGKSPDERVADQALIQQIFTTPFDGSVNPLFCCIFNMLGIWPMIYAATLLPGADRQSPAPALPFVAGSFFLGAFALSPYLALRENRSVAGQSGEIDWATANILENRLTAVVLLAFAAYLALFAVGNGVIGGFSPSEALSGFMPVFGSSLTAHVSSLDFMVLWMLFGPVLLEDGRRRGVFLGSPDSWSAGNKAQFAVSALLPVFGGLAWLLSRPPLPKSQRS